MFNNLDLEHKNIGYTSSFQSIYTNCLYEYQSHTKHIFAFGQNAISMKGLFLLILHCGILFSCKGQSDISINWSFDYIQENNTRSKMNQNTQETLRIDALKFYVSNISLWQDTQLVWQDQTTAHLIDATDPLGCQLGLSSSNDKQFNRIKFNLGIDSTSNVSGALAGDLDPTKGMYWTWQSGYINLKIEGHYDKDFQYHIGGYLAPNNALQQVQLNIIKQHKIQINFDIRALMVYAQTKGLYHIMSPSQDACLLAQKAAQLFSIL
jgi:hypothetical protein